MAFSLRLGLLLCMIGTASGAVKPQGAIAQTVTADGTVGTTVTGSGPFTITGGTTQGANLFHSFGEFSPNTATTEFSVGGTIERIFGRVTGTNPSNIDGILRVTGGINPDLFLINPNGIVFGPNAQLDMTGSFIGSTANSVVFPNDIQFAANDTTVAPLLTINRPIGLRMSSSSAAITVNSSGHALQQPVDVLPIVRLPSTQVLEVDTGQTLGLLGSEINLAGGVLMAESGTAALGAVHNGTVGLKFLAPGWRFDYDQVSSLGNISLAQQSLIDVSSDSSGATSGTAQLVGSTIELTDGSVVLGQNTSSQKGGLVEVLATEALNIRGVGSLGNLRSTLRLEALGQGASGDLAINAKNLRVHDGGQIIVTTAGFGNGGNLDIEVTETFNVEGFAPGNPAFVTSVGTSVLPTGIGQAGTLTVNTGTLNVLDGGVLLSLTLSQSPIPNTGSSGDVDVSAKREINISGENPFFLVGSALGTSSFSRGNAGSLILRTARLNITNGGRVNTAIAALGNAGSLTIEATESISVSGISPSGKNPSAIIASADEQDPITQLTLGLPPQPTGTSGDVRIRSPYLEVSQGAEVTARHEGTGDSGQVNIVGETIYLNEGGNISASTQSGAGGEINLRLQKLLLLRRGSLISAEAGGSGNGGNITINAPVIAGYENSDIVANAFAGNGGNINITTQGIFGLVFRNQLTPENDITASSQFGVSGTISVNEFSLDPSSGLVTLVTALSDASAQVDSTCATAGNSEFIVTGRGGIPPAPETQSGGTVGPWQDNRDLSEFLGATAAPPQRAEAPAPLREATGFQTLPTGQIALVAEPGHSPHHSHHATCAIAATAQ